MPYLAAIKRRRFRAKDAREALTKIITVEIDTVDLSERAPFPILMGRLFGGHVKGEPMSCEKQRFINVRVAQECLDHLEGLRHERSQREGKRVSLREIFAEALELYLRSRSETH